MKTKKYKITPQEYFQIALLNIFSRNKLPILLIFIILLVLVRQDSGALIQTVAFIFIGISVWLSAKSKKNNPIYQERYLELDDNFLLTYLYDGSADKYNINNVIDFIERKTYFLIYVSKDNFYYIPFTCFESDADRMEFKKIIKEKLMNGRGTPPDPKFTTPR